MDGGFTRTGPLWAGESQGSHLGQSATDTGISKNSLGQCVRGPAQAGKRLPEGSTLGLFGLGYFGVDSPGRLWHDASLVNKFSVLTWETKNGNEQGERGGTSD